MHPLRLLLISPKYFLKELNVKRISILTAFRAEIQLSKCGIRTNSFSVLNSLELGCILHIIMYARLFCEVNSLKVSAKTLIQVQWKIKI